MLYKLFTEMAQATGLENIRPERTLSGVVALTPVNSFSSITLENNEKIRPMPGGEKLSCKASGDPGVIRTRGLRFRKPSLYPAELRGLIGWFWIEGSGMSCKVFAVVSDGSHACDSW